jgi:hypothetical protein
MIVILMAICTATFGEAPRVATHQICDTSCLCLISGTSAYQSAALPLR